MALLKHSFLAPFLEKVGPCAPSVVLIPFLIAICELSCFSYVGFFVIRWTVDRQSPLSMGFFRQERWSGLPFPSPGHLPDSGIEPRSPALPADSLPSEL